MNWPASHATGQPSAACGSLGFCPGLAGCAAGFGRRRRDSHRQRHGRADGRCKSPGTRYCFHSYCHRVGTLAQTDTLVGWRGYVLASYYDSCHPDWLNPCGLTSSGAVFRANLPDNAASPLLPDGTVILAYNPKAGDASVLRITNAGPYSEKRKLDVSRAAAEKLGFRKQGVAALVISVLHSPTRAEANYVGGRVYPRVPGYVGRFATVDIALKTAQARFDLREASRASSSTSSISTTWCRRTTSCARSTPCSTSAGFTRSWRPITRTRAGHRSIPS